MADELDTDPGEIDRYRILVDAIADYAIYMLDPSGRVTSWNAGARRFKGYDAEEIVGEHFSRFYTEEDRRAGEPEKALRTAATEGRFEKEGWRVRKSGERFWAHVVIDPIRDPTGMLIGFAKITRDISERRQARLSLEQARQALFQAQKLDAIGQLTGGVAHDFNNLLMAVLGSLELLRKRLSAADPKATILLDNAMQGAQRGAALTQRMLAFARKQDLRLEGVDVPNLVRGMQGLLERALGPAIRMRTHFPNRVSPAFADANQLEIALLNLAVNARDAMPDGGEIVIEVTENTVSSGEADLLPEGAYVRLAVIDRGGGMDEATLARATEPFFTTKGVGKGTGLGLPMVHGMAEQSGGRLVVTSKVGEGTRVEIWLPQAPNLGVRKTADLPGETPGTRPLVVLAVDDDELVLANITAMLEDLGHTAIAASSAGEALETLRHQAVHIVVTDYAMPQMTGLDLSLAIRADYPGLPVILATGFAELPPGAGEDLPRLAKPYTQLELARLLQTMCAEEVAG